MPEAGEIEAPKYERVTGGLGLGLGLGLGASTLDATRSRIGGAKKEQRVLPVTEGGLGDDVIDFSYLDSAPIRNEPGSASATAVEALVENAEEEAPEEEHFDPNENPRWCPPGTVERLGNLQSPLIRLHQEIVDFSRYLEPTEDEAASRAAAVERVRDIVKDIWPDARFEVHGSFATGMYLPSSDIDAVILDSGAKNPALCLKALAISLARKGMARKIQLIAKARVPIVKFEEVQSGHQFDISFDVANGPASAEIVRDNMKRFPALRPLTTVLKAFLHQRGLNEVYSGGIGSYALLCMVMAHLQLHNTTCKSTWAGSHGASDASEGCLGTLLIDFFELFGRRLNADEVGISCGGKGPGFFKKRDKGMFEENRPFLWAIEDPQDETNDLGRNSYACRQVKSAFEHAFTVITAPVDSRHGFLLRRIVKMDPSWCKGRKPPKNPGAIRGVALDFPKYVDLGRKRAAREQKQTAEREARGKKRARVEEVEDVSGAEVSVSESEEGQAEEETPKTKKKTKRGKRGTAHKQRAPGYFAKGRPNKKQKTGSSQ
jgi:non-canonical poly(A) RNA polymerase PAPD5/7